MEESISVEDYFKYKFRTNKWFTFQVKSNEYTNKVYINQDFYGQHRAIARKFRCNKKNSSRYHNISEENYDCDQRTGILAPTTHDLVYETAIPNTVKKIF